MKIGVYPGTFDPITLGHLNIIRRSAHKICDKLIIAVAKFSGKDALFTIDERVAMIQHELKNIEPEVRQKIEVQSFSNLLIDFMQDNNASMIIRGLRAISDFEYEFQLAGMNKNLNPHIETVFLMADEGHHFIASRLVKEIAVLGGNTIPFVGEYIAGQLQAKYKTR